MTDTAKAARSDEANPAVTDAARSGEPDRYLAALLSPPGQRGALLGLAALSAELARIPPRTAREPAMGEIRLQWWRDALAMPPALRTGHPVADAVRNALSSHGLSADHIDPLIDGRLLQLQRNVPLSEEEQRDLLWKTEGTLFALGARAMGRTLDGEVEAGCTACGRAYGLARTFVQLPQALSHGHIPLTAAQLEVAGLSVEDLLAGVSDGRIERLLANADRQIRTNLAVARQFTARLPRPARVAFLPLALVEPYLRVLGRTGPALLREEARLAPFTRVCRIAAAHLLGR